MVKIVQNHRVLQMVKLKIGYLDELKNQWVIGSPPVVQKGSRAHARRTDH
jgi:hypothetical protein